MAMNTRAQRQFGVETELASAEARISQLQRDLFDIRQRLNGTMPILDMLPEDIMVEIFQHVLPVVPNDPELTGYGCLVKPAQFTLGAVCRTWRNIAWGFPGLWKDLRLTFISDPTRTEVQVDLIQEWIHRTGQLPLHISLSLQAITQQTILDLDRILRLLLQECRRWSCLQVAGQGTHRLRAEMFEGDYFFPRLNSIFLGTDSHKKPSSMAIPWTFKTESNLRNLTMGKGTHFRRKKIVVNWRAVHHFRFVGCEALGMIFMSEMTESLRSVRAAFHTTNDTNEIPFVRLPALQELTIGDDDRPQPINDGCLITRLETPGLQRLHLYLDPLDTHIPLLTAMVVRSQCSLVELSLDNFDESMDQLLGLLLVLPTLRTLSFNSFEDFALTDEFIDALNPPEGQLPTQGPCLPNISEIAYRGPMSFSPQKTIDMLRSRLGTSGSQESQPPALKQIKSFTILCENPDWATKTDQNDLRSFYHEIWALKSLGTIFDITYEKSYS